MLDVLGNLDTVNYIVQEGLQSALSKSISIRNNFYEGDGFGVDVIKGKGSNALNFRIRTSTLQTLCTVYMEKNSVTFRYSPTLILKLNTKTGTVSTNLFEEAFTLDEMEGTFFMQNTIGFGIALTDDFDCNTMIETIKMGWRVHEAFVSYIQTKDA
jgi:hypothetical protein